MKHIFLASIFAITLFVNQKSKAELPIHFIDGVAIATNLYSIAANGWDSKINIPNGLLLSMAILVRQVAQLQKTEENKKYVNNLAEALFLVSTGIAVYSFFE